MSASCSRQAKPGSPENATPLQREEKLGHALQVKLRRMHLHVEAPDSDTLHVRSVPVNAHGFNKPTTNLLVKRTAENGRCLICVDEDLSYLGRSAELAKAFAMGATQQGWRVLAFGGSVCGNLGAALEYAIEILNEVDFPPELQHSPPVGGKLLDAWGVDLTARMPGSQPKVTLFRDEDIEQISACILGWQGRIALLAGEPGTGKTNLLSGVAQSLAARGRRVVAVNLGALMAGALFESEREFLLSALLREAAGTESCLALEQAEWALIGLPRGAVLLRDALDCGSTLLATTIPEHVPRFSVPPLGARIEITAVKELCCEDALRVLELLQPKLESHHNVRIGKESLQAAVERSLALAGALPEKALRLLDLAAARARINQAASVAPIDIYIVASRMLGQVP